MLLDSLAATARMDRTWHPLLSPKKWSLRLAEVLQFGSLKAGHHRLLQPLPSRRQWMSWKSARHKGTQRDGLCRSNMWHPMPRTQEAKQAQSLPNRQQCLAQAGQEPDQRHKAPSRSYRLHNVNRYRAKKLVRRRCPLPHALVGTRAEQSRRRTHLLHSRPLEDQSLVALLHPVATRTVSPPWQHPQQRPHRATSRDPSLDLVTSSQAPCLHLQAALPMIVSTAVSRTYLRCSLPSSYHSRINVATSAALLLVASQIVCLVAPTRADNRRRTMLAHQPRRKTEDTRPSA